MSKQCLKIRQLSLFAVLVFGLYATGAAQLKNYTITAKGDTINGVNAKGEKHGKWVINVPELRGEPGYEEEGQYKNGKKEGVWRQFTLEGDLIGVENFQGGEKAWLQQYFTYLGDLVREEQWKPFNPEDPYDTVAVYGTGSNEILEYKIVPAIPYSVKHGEWRYYEPGSGRLLRTEKWELNRLIVPGAKTQEPTAAKDEKPKEKVKPKEVVEFEKKNAKKKNVKVLDGATRQ